MCRSLLPASGWCQCNLVLTTAVAATEWDNAQQHDGQNLYNTEPVTPGEEQVGSPSRRNVSPAPQEKVEKVASISKKTDSRSAPRSSPLKVAIDKTEMVGDESPIWALRRINPFETQGAVMVVLLYCVYLAIGTVM